MTTTARAVRHDYSDQASRYDASRGVSSAVLDAVTIALQGARVGSKGGTRSTFSAPPSAPWSANRAALRVQTCALAIGTLIARNRDI